MFDFISAWLRDDEEGGHAVTRIGGALPSACETEGFAAWAIEEDLRQMSEAKPT
jgi:hypothetical protein